MDDTAELTPVTIAFTARKDVYDEEKATPLARAWFNLQARLAGAELGILAIAEILEDLPGPVQTEAYEQLMSIAESGGISVRCLWAASRIAEAIESGRPVPDELQ